MEADIIALFAVNNFAKFGKRLESLRKSKNLTQNKLCLKSGVSKNSISAYECHKRSPQKNTVKKLAKGLNVNSAILEDHIEFYEKAPEYLCNFNPETGEFNLFREE
ncbi:MAG: helix-turn-helix transcriptional regulator [Victivallaceae bacterium]|nr:helix-turn-helix transcriptional regulator [Victivallaceae bacterium]